MSISSHYRALHFSLRQSDTLVYMQMLTLLTIPSKNVPFSKKFLASDCYTDR